MGNYDPPLWRSTIGSDRLFDLAEETSVTVAGFTPQDLAITVQQKL
jgi:hypothetical protein